MIEARSNTTRHLGLWSLVGTVVLLSAVPPARAAGESVRSLDAVLSAPASTMVDVVADKDADAEPPAGEGSYRPSHYSVASVVVVVQRTRFVIRTRMGGLHGP